ncbi:MAG: PAS domain S-box protein [Bacteroidetes bacterium]|nr:PAS domain S-box protein [Bacteroidota bacterium]
MDPLLNLQDKEENQRADFFALINNMPDIVFSFDMNLKLINFNIAFTKLCIDLFGHAPVMGVLIFDLFSGTDQDIINNLISNARNGEHYSLEKELSRNGILNYYDISLNPIIKENEEQIGISVYAKNITEKKKAQKDLQDSHERYEYVTQATFDAIWDLNLEDDELYWGEGFEKLFGYKSEENKGDIVLWYEHIHEEDRPRILNSINALIKGKNNNWSEEYRFMKANGDIAFVRNKGLVVRNVNGKGIRMIGAMQDITSQKKEEQQLKLFKSVITNSSEVVVITETMPIDGIGPRILFVNEAFTKLTGYTYEEIIGKTPRILQGPLTNKAELVRLKESMRKWEPCEIEILNYKKNGETYWSNISVMPLANETGHFTHWISIQRNITERKKEAIEIAFFYDLIQTVNSNEALELTLSICIEKISKYFGYAYAEAWLVNIDDTKMLYKANWASNEKAAKFRDAPTISSSSRGRGIMGKSWIEKKILYFDDIQHSEFLSKSNADFAGLTSVLTLPIFYNERVIAMFNFFNHKPFTFEQISSDLINKISKQFGSSIQKSRTDDELNRFFNLSPDLLCIIGFDGYFKKVNHAVTKLLGYTEYELLRREISSFYDVGKEENFANGKDNFLNEQNIVNYENRILTKSGEMKWLAWTAVPIAEEDVIFAVAKDITEKKQMELERENILESISDCFYALDRNFNFQYLNKPAQVLLKKSSEELIGKNVFDIYPFLMEGIFYENFELSVRKKVPVHFEIQLNGSSNWYEESFYPTEDGVSIFFRSINERKKIEEEIKSAYTQKNTILESITDGFFTIDKEYKVTYFNKEAERLLKVTRFEMLGKYLFDLFPEAIESISKHEYSRALTENVAVHFEDYFEPLNTSFEVSAYPSEIGLSVYFKDITETKRLITLEQLEKEVLERNTKQDAILSETISYYLAGIEQLHPGMTCTVLRLEGNALFNWAGPSINQEYANSINGVAIGENVGSCGTAAYLKQKVLVSDINSDPRWTNFKTLALKAGYQSCWSYPIINSFGNVLGTFAIYHKAIRFPNIDEENNILRALNILKVIIENKLFEEELLQMNERYNLVTKATNDIIWDWNIKTGEVYRTGDGALSLIDSNTDLYSGTNAYWITRIHPDDIDRITAEMKSFLEDKSRVYWSCNYRFRKADETYANFYEKGYLTRNENKEPVRMIGASRDITMQIQTELLLKELNDKLQLRADELAKSNEELERFAYITSHDLQEPLRMVTGFLDLIQKRNESKLDETANKYIGFAVDGANRMKRLINDLLHFSRITSTKYTLMPVDTNEIAEEMKELFKTKLQSYNATLLVDSLPIVNADKTSISQLLQNLISNALKYRSSDRDPIVKVSAIEQSNDWVFLVEDNGIGIDPKFFDKIFIIFQRLHNKNEYSGTGIGLAICKKIAERLKGTIWVESKPGFGSKFYFSIPK